MVAAIGTSVDLTWIFFKAQTSFILTHNEAVYNIPNLLSMFDLFSVVGASDVCVGGQSFTVVNVSIPNVTSAHAGNYILNSTGALFAASVFLSGECVCVCMCVCVYSKQMSQHAEIIISHS